MSCIIHVVGIAVVTLPMFITMYIFDPDPFGTEMIDTLLWSILYSAIIYGITYGILLQVNPGLINKFMDPIMNLLKLN